MKSRKCKSIGRSLTVVVVAVIAAMLVCMGCGEVKEVRLVSYVSTDSTVYTDTTKLVNDVANSVVEIRTESITTQWGMQYIVSGAGSGVIVARRDDSGYYIVTNNHVIDGASEIEVTLRDGSDPYEATLIATDVRSDIAVLSINETCALNVATWGNSDQLQVGEDLIAIGNPLGALGGTVTKGILSAKARSIAVGNYTMNLLQTDTAINPGNSGGGLFNMRGELIGIVNAKTSDEEVEGICFAIPANTALSVFNDLVENGVVTGRITLGVEVSVDGKYVYVTDASGAESGKFEKYDWIESINGKTLTSLLDYNDAIGALAPGDEATVVVHRGEIRTSQGVFGQNSQLVFYRDSETFTVTARQLEAI